VTLYTLDCIIDDDHSKTAITVVTGWTELTAGLTGLVLVVAT